jgi:hypothetical protein
MMGSDNMTTQINNFLKNLKRWDRDNLLPIYPATHLL